MKRAVYLILFISATLFSCTRSNAVNRTLDGKWRMILVEDHATGTTESKPSAVQGDVDIVFADTSTTGGTINGFTPTNSLFADYSTGAHNTLSIPSVFATQVIETTWGTSFLDNITSSVNYTFTAEGDLRIHTGTIALVFKRL
jgi:hypothetical protein